MKKRYLRRARRAIKSFLIFAALAVEVIVLSLSLGSGDQRVEARTPAETSKVVRQKPTGKLSSRLQILSQPATRSASATAQADRVGLPETGPGSLTYGERGQLLVYIRVTDVSTDTRQTLQAAGATIRHVSPQYRTITAVADVAHLPNRQRRRLPELRQSSVLTSWPLSSQSPRDER